jgi:hypothetical protein
MGSRVCVYMGDAAFRVAAIGRVFEAGRVWEQLESGRVRHRLEPLVLAATLALTRKARKA